MKNLQSIIHNLKKIAVSVIENSKDEAQELLKLWKQHKVITDFQKNKLTGPKGQKNLYTIKFDSLKSLQNFLSKVSGLKYNPNSYSNKLDYFGSFQFEGNVGIFSRSNDDDSSVYLISGFTENDLSNLNQQLRS